MTTTRLIKLGMVVCWILREPPLLSRTVAVTLKLFSATEEEPTMLDMGVGGIGPGEFNYCVDVRGNGRATAGGQG